jgi:hypothetical protein
MPNSKRCGLILDRSPQPDVIRKPSTLKEVGIPFHESLGPARPLCQNLVHMPRCHEHDLEYGPDEMIRDVLMEQVTHTVHKDIPRPRPVQRIAEALRPKANCEWVAPTDVRVDLRRPRQVDVTEETVG